MFRLRSPEYWVEHWHDDYGPTHKTFQTIDNDSIEALATDLIAWARSNA